MSRFDLNVLGNLLRRLEEEREDALYDDNEKIKVVLRQGTRIVECRIVGVYLDYSSSKEELRIDVCPIKR